jgi:hypothetical protein
MLDAAALLLSATDFSTEEHATEESKGPMMALAYGMPTLARIGRSAGLPLPPPVLLMELIARVSEPVPDISIGRDEYITALDRLHPLLSVPGNERERCWRRYGWIRSGYDQALRGLAGLTLAPPALWTTDRPARVGRPRILLSRPLTVDWSARPPDVSPAARP